jgi:hypothetical protein
MAQRRHGKRRQASTRGWAEPFVFTFRAGLRTLAQDLRVFLWLLGIMKRRNQVRAFQTSSRRRWACPGKMCGRHSNG